MLTMLVNIHDFYCLCAGDPCKQLYTNLRITDKGVEERSENFIKVAK